MNRYAPLLLLVFLMTLGVMPPGFSQSAQAASRTTSVDPTTDDHFIADGDLPLSNSADEARAVALGKKLRCVTCQSESINDSQSDMARNMRELVREKIRYGWSDNDITEFLRQRYGDFILLKPQLRAKTVFLWLCPLVFLGLAGWSGFLFLRRQQPVPAPPLTKTAPTAPPPAAKTRSSLAAKAEAPAKTSATAVKKTPVKPRKPPTKKLQAVDAAANTIDPVAPATGLPSETAIAPTEMPPAAIKQPRRRKPKVAPVTVLTETSTPLPAAEPALPQPEAAALRTTMPEPPLKDAKITSLRETEASEEIDFPVLPPLAAAATVAPPLNGAHAAAPATAAPIAKPLKTIKPRKSRKKPETPPT